METKLEIGEYTYGEKNITIKDWNSHHTVKIGKFCSISQNLIIYVDGNHRTEWISTYPFAAKGFNVQQTRPKEWRVSKGDVTIENDVWIGSDVTIMSGVTIKNGACIGANSVVTKNVPPYTIVAGNPAKIIRKRFTDDEIESLLKIKWWNWDNKKIQDNVQLLCSPNISEFIKKHENINNTAVLQQD